jgi:hypothetical protein
MALNRSMPINWAEILPLLVMAPENVETRKTSMPLLSSDRMVPLLTIPPEKMEMPLTTMPPCSG